MNIISLFRSSGMAKSTIMLCFVGFAAICSAQFGGGQGTEADPWHISRVAHLDNIRNHLSSHYIQTANIDLREAPWNEGTGWVPIGISRDEPFNGSYNGHEYEIIGLTIDRNEDFQGLFGASDGAILVNISLREVDILGRSYTGALVGFANNTGLNNCSATGTVTSTGGMGVGGLLGRYSGNARDSYADVEVSAPNSDRVGGFIGDGWGDMRRCRAVGDVTGRNRVGGLAGNDYNNHQQGELVATGNVTGNNQVGGMFGLKQTATYYDVYATGNVSGNDQIGGYAGRSEFWGSTHRGYAIGRVAGEGETGGFIGSERPDPDQVGDVVNCYWNTETTGQAQSRGGEPRDSRHMTYPYEPNTYENWDFNDIWQNDEENFNEGYPYFQWQNLAPIIIIDPPLVSIGFVTIDDSEHVRLNWQPVDDALSYRVYSSTDPHADDWGEPVQVLGNEATEYTEVLHEQNRNKFFQVTASSEEAP